LDEEALIVWQDVLDEVFAGRGDGLSCPKCGHNPLEVTRKPDGVTVISCRGCGEFLEGRFGH
jgi:transcription elongation factor Elf1